MCAYISAARCGGPWCEWHSAAFNVRDGQRVKGPAQQETRLLTLPT
jgi:nitrite reductase/ring-hydroxylating ferredoxin subunit